jgi:apolipoprotein N-acyltransferase
MPNRFFTQRPFTQPWPKHPLAAQLSLALGAGLAMGVAAAPLNWWPLAWVSLMPLWVLVLPTPTSETDGPLNAVFSGKRIKRRRLLAALVWGLGYYGLTLSWIIDLHPLTWLGVPWLASVAIALFCWVFITLWGVACVVIWAILVQTLLGGPQGRSLTGSTLPSPYSMGCRVLVSTAIWCSLEWLRNQTPLDWAPLAFTQSPGNLAVLHLGQLSGPWLISAGIVAVNGLLAEMWMAQRRPQWAVATLVGLGLAMHGIGLGLLHQPLPQPMNQALTIGIVQGNIPTRIKLSPNGIRQGIQGYLEGYNQLTQSNLTGTQVDGVLTPEGALPFIWNPATNPLLRAVEARRVPLWLGTFVADTPQRLTQSLLSLGADGAVVGRYSKVKLVPLGEYIPFAEVVGRLINRLSPVSASLQPGRADQVFETPFGRAIAAICYESAFPGLFRGQTRAGGQWIITASNLDPYSQVLMSQHQAQDLMRAIETSRWAVRATNTGYSGVIDPHGKIIWRSQPKRYQTHAETIYRRSSQTLYVRWGNWSLPLLLLAGSIMLLVERARLL